MRFALIALAFAVPASGAAQARLTGTYVDYFHVSSNGTFIQGSESMRYTEDGIAYSCDAFYPGSPVEQWTVQGTTTDGRSFAATQSGGFGGGVWMTTAPTMLAGRSITWSGTYTDGSGVSLEIDQTVTYEMADRHVRVTVVLTNLGTTAITDVYYLRNADPDHASSCADGTGPTTFNDVRLQPPANDSALVTARGDFTMGTDFVLGIGAHDPRARAYAGGFSNTDGEAEWTAPMDPEGMAGDVGQDIIFREASLGAGLSTTFEWFYVWGTTEMEVETRFTDLGAPTAPCMGIPEGMPCTTSGGSMGVCRMSVCCTGCWDGTRCRGGRTADFCGMRGGTCRSCVDTDPCTNNVCTTGACSNPPAPVGSACDDGRYCSATSTCNALGACVEATSICDDMRTCTNDICDETTRMCRYEMTVGCVIGGECVAPGAMHVSNPCLTCDPARTTSDWSPVAAGTACGRETCSAGRLRPAPTCTAAGTCMAGTTTMCPSGFCADATSCGVACEDAGCAEGEFCDTRTHRCQPLLPMGGPCSDGTQCLTGVCVDGNCCNVECDGTCEACNVPGSVGTCTPHAMGTDPEGECPAPGECDGASACAGAPRVDAGPPVDAGMGGEDAGPPVGGDTGPGGVDAGMETGGGRDEGGCCSIPAARRPATLPLLFAAALALAAVTRRRKKRD